MKVSVIVAVYNASGTLDRLIKSLIKQSLRDFEIIAIDDGSTDGSGELLERYALTDKRLHVFHQTNCGVSASRQKGLEHSTGEYVIHADADDYVESNMLEALYSKAKEDDADVVFCDYFADKVNTKSIRLIQKPPKNTSDILKALLRGLHGSCWNKLVRRSVFERYNIRFPEGLNYCEDLLTWIQIYQHPEIRTSYVPQAFYHYVSNGQSITRSGSHSQLEQIRLFTRRMVETLPKGDTYIDQYIKTLPIAPFLYAFQHKLTSNDESRREYLRIRSAVQNDTKSLRWKIGYLLMDLNLVNLARIFIKL